MPRLTGLDRAGQARHRLGTPGLVHCTAYSEVELALAEFHRNWLAALLVPARHSWAGLRKRARTARPAFAPA